MSRRLMISCVFMVFLISSFAHGQAISDYYYGNNFLMGTSSSYNDGLLGFANPANLAFLHSSEMRFNWSTDDDDFGSFNDWGLFLAVPHVGFGMVRRDLGQWSSRDYQISLGFGDDKHSFGLAYGWSSHSVDYLAKEQVIKISSVGREIKYLSVGLIGEFSLESKARQGIAEIGIRPLGNSMITLFGDMAMRRKTVFEDAPWSAGVVFEPVQGIHLTGRYFENETFTVGLTFDFGVEAISSQMYFDSDQEHSYTTYSARLGGMRPSFIPPLVERDGKYLKINLKGRMNYLGYRFGGE